MTIIIRKPSEEEIKEMNTCPTWSCEPSTFDWEFEAEERCLILEGKATVNYNGQTFDFGAGDYVIFPKGMVCVWTVHETIKKHYKHIEAL